ncbi:uncharacterized protein LOC103701569 isoform X2 [Phoenix dactylifera]|uniref:Uncharacterized protein LOC103701569 isoform X2 n=1 Tax=Phoenix dactylifera TaxID=42345 RepID=A0A8B9ACB2_PHODC|nr:uncharacterized protein LOC103701569 isoform X2 [Phoenix dactylifera]
MAKFLWAKAKRKDLEPVRDDFSDFLFASQSKKFKTLDAELPLVIKEEEPVIPLEFEQQLPKEQTYSSMQQARAVMAENIPDFKSNGNSKFCFHKPLKAAVVQSPCSTDVSFRLHSDLISGQYFLPRDPNLMIMEEVPMENRPVPVKNHFDVVPLVPSQAFVTSHVIEDVMSRSNLLEPMEAEEEQDALMELEEDMEQQYHMTAQLYTSNPVLWSGFF